MSTATRKTAPTAVRFVVFGLGYALVQVILLRQWASADPWSRLDVFSATCVGLNLGPSLFSARLRRALGASGAQAFFAGRYARRTGRFVPVLWRRRSARPVR